MYELLQERFPWRKNTVTRDDPGLQSSDLPSAPTHQPTGPGSGQQVRETWVSGLAEGSSSSTSVEQVSPSVGKRRATGDQSEDVLVNYARTSLDEDRAAGDLQETVSTFSHFWNYIQPKIVAPKPVVQENHTYVDPYAHVRNDPYLGQNVYPVINDWGYKTNRKEEVALLRLTNQFDAGEQMDLTPFVEPDSDSEYGDTPPSLTSDNSTIVDDNSVVGSDEL
uniref:hypothetical protein n=1 Tax=Lentinus flexipes TaxID=3163629 RepID=UPI002263F52A|nr:hypothetical protein OSR58_mgp42 [Ganoderma flexipes]UYX56919.1 hypothetical protein [Ganoderma flexipes]